MMMMCREMGLHRFASVMHDDDEWEDDDDDEWDSEDDDVVVQFPKIQVVEGSDDDEAASSRQPPSEASNALSGENQVSYLGFVAFCVFFS